MLSDILSTFIVLGVCYLLITVPVGLLNIKLFQAIHGSKATGRTLIKLFIPGVNIMFSRKLLYGTALLHTLLFAVCGFGLVFRVAALLLLEQYPALTPYSAFLMFGCLIAYGAAYALSALDMCLTFECGFWVFLACLLVAPVGYYMVSTQVLRYFSTVEDDVRGTFEIT